jgi:predicted glycoside hydrolase/deacetylase ChbG (UPF0249 family)
MAESAGLRRVAATTRLIVNADDLGLAESVNRGIVEAIESGIVTSASLIVNMPACEDAIRRLREAQKRGVAASIGLHFNIVAGKPLSECATLTRRHTNEFRPLATLAWCALTGRVEIRDIELELEAQLQKATDLLAPLGLRVTHIDSHRHAHCLPEIFDAVLRSARRHGIGHVRHPNETRATLRGRPHAVIASRLLRAVLAQRPALDDVGFTGIGVMGSRTFDRDVAAIVSALPPGTTELMVHPGYDSAELAAIDPYRSPRERELRALTSPALRERIRDLGVELTRFDATIPSA